MPHYKSITDIKLPHGYKEIKNFPYYCINDEDKIYSKISECVLQPFYPPSENGAVYQLIQNNYQRDVTLQEIRKYL